GVGACRGAGCAGRAAGLLADALDWSSERSAAEVAAFAAERWRSAAKALGGRHLAAFEIHRHVFLGARGFTRHEQEPASPPPRQSAALEPPASGDEGAARSEAESAEPSEAHRVGAEGAARGEAESAEPSEAHRGGDEGAGRSEAESAEPSEPHRVGAEGAAPRAPTAAPPGQRERLASRPTA